MLEEEGWSGHLWCSSSRYTYPLTSNTLILENILYAVPVVWVYMETGILQLVPLTLFVCFGFSRHRQRTLAWQGPFHLVVPEAPSEIRTGFQWSNAPWLAHLLKASAVKEGGGGTFGATVLAPAWRK